MKSAASIFIALTSFLLLLSCVSSRTTDTEPHINWTSKYSLNYILNSNSGLVHLPETSRINKENSLLFPLTATNNGWDINTDLKIAPTGTDSTIWGWEIVPPDYKLPKIDLINIDMLLKKANEHTVNLSKLPDGSEMYVFGFENIYGINLSLVKSVKKNGIAHLEKENLEKNLFIGMSQPEKRIYTRKELKNIRGETIGYASACSISQDPSITVSFNAYCILISDGAWIKEFIYPIPLEYTQSTNSLSIKSKYVGGLDWKDYVNTDFYKETQKFGEKTFNNLYDTNMTFKKYIDQLEANLTGN